MNEIVGIKLVLFLVAFGLALSCAQSRLLGKWPISATPEIFAPGFVSLEDVFEFGSVISPNGREVFYGVQLSDRSEIRSLPLAERSDATPTIEISHPNYGFNDPFFSADGDRLYYISQMPDGLKTEQNYDIWYSRKSEKGWSEPINAGAPINSPYDEYYISFTQDGSMFFSSNRDSSHGWTNNFNIYRSNFRNDHYETPEILSDSINTRAYEADVFVSPKEDYLIFCSIRKGGLGQGDLYISLKRANNEWSKARHMGDLINTDGHELCPYVTSDGNYFFYTSRKDIYWVLFPPILEAFRSEILN